MDAYRFLRPCLQRTVKPARCPSYARFFSAFSQSCAKQSPKAPVKAGENDYEKRIAQLQKYGSLEDCYPRVTRDGRKSSVQDVRRQAGRLEANQSDKDTILRITGTDLAITDPWAKG